MWRPRFTELAAEDERILLRRSERNLGCAGGRRLGAELADTPYILFLDDDAELRDGALEQLVAELESFPDAAGVTPVVVDPNDTLQHYGGDLSMGDGVAWFTLAAKDLNFTEAALPPSGPTGWLPGTSALVRRSVLREIPIDGRMVPYYEDNEWSYRVVKEGHGFRRCRDALAIHHHTWDRPPPPGLIGCSFRIERLVAVARFYELHQLVLGVDLSDLVPELQLDDGTTDLAALRLLLELISSRGPDWTVMEWMNGGLAPLWCDRDRDRTAAGTSGPQVAELQSRNAYLEEKFEWLYNRHLALSEIERGGWWALRRRLLPLLRLVDTARRLTKPRERS